MDKTGEEKTMRPDLHEVLFNGAVNTDSANKEEHYVYGSPYDIEARLNEYFEKLERRHGEELAKAKGEGRLEVILRLFDLIQDTQLKQKIDKVIDGKARPHEVRAMDELINALAKLWGEIKELQPVGEKSSSQINQAETVTE